MYVGQSTAPSTASLPLLLRGSQWRESYGLTEQKQTNKKQSWCMQSRGSYRFPRGSLTQWWLPRKAEEQVDRDKWALKKQKKAIIEQHGEKTTRKKILRKSSSLS